MMKNKLFFPSLVLLFLSLAAATVAAQPMITSFTPTAGSAGDTVIINGSGFASGSISVLFYSGRPAASLYVNSDSQMTVTVPTGISTGAIAVQTGSGSPTYSPQPFTAIGYGPYITGMTPAYGAVGDTVVVNGAHFLYTTNVKFGSISVGGDFLSSSDGATLTTHVPSGATNASITVATYYGTSNSPSMFTIIGPGPFVSGFSPWIGNSSATVSIEGRFLTGASAVKFNNVAGTFSYTSDTLITAHPPAGVTTGPISVTTPNGTFTTSSNFYAPPTLTGFSPASGAVGSTVTINGTSFTGATAVNFNGTAQTSFSINAAGTQIMVAVPSGATTGPIQVAAPASSPYSSSSFVVLPSITSVSPGNGPVGAAVVITGANLAGASAVKFNTASVSPSATSYNSVSATVPAGATSGYISVTTPDGTAISPAVFYLPPSISGFNPANGAAGAAVNVTGANFTNASAVTFAGVPAASFVVSNNTLIRAYAPVGVTTGVIGVTTPGGSASSAGTFYGPPYVSGFNPTHGLPGTQVTINGLNFLGATHVQFSGLDATVNSLVNTQIVATVPVGAQTGVLSVVTPGGTTNSAGLFTLDYQSDLQLTGTDSPDPVFAGSNLTYTITVYNNSDLSAPNVWITNTLPAGVVLTSASLGGGTVITNNLPMVLGNVGTLGNRLTAQLTINLKAPLASGTITNLAQVTSAYTDPAPANNFVAISTTVLPLPWLSIQRTASTNQFRLSWPVELTNFSVQTTPFLQTNAVWTNVPTTPSVQSTNRFIIETNRAPMQFYRLKS